MVRYQKSGTHAYENLESESHDTESLQDANDGEAWETLREIGYEKGDNVLNQIAYSDRVQSTTSDTYTTFDQDILGTQYVWDIMFPSNVTAVLGLTGRVDPNGDQVDVRIYNASDDEIIAEKTGITAFDSFTIEPVEYTPTTTDVTVNIRVQFRNGDNATSVNCNRASLVGGYRI